MEKYYVNYYVTGVLVIEANSLDGAANVAMDVSEEQLMTETDFKDGFYIRNILDDNGNIYEDDEFEIDGEDRLGFIVSTQ